MRPVCYVPVGVLMLMAAAVSSPAADDVTPIDQQRVEQWKAMLPAAPRGVGPTIENRQAWQTVAQSEQFKDAVKKAEQLLSKPMPEMTDDLYLDYSRTGNRKRGEAVQGQRKERVNTLVLAECIENRGRFLPAIEEAIRSTCGEKTWMYPGHDAKLMNFKGHIIEIDLRSSEMSWILATARFWLGDKLSADVRKLIDDELERRTFTPFVNLVTKGQPKMWWLTTTNNWNAVCLAGVTGAAMANIESPERRAFFAAAAEKYIQNFLSGFTPDGYCSEGVGYWNYGFGHYMMLAETLKQATGGKVDMMESDHVRQAARFSQRLEILPGIYPAFADCDPSARPSQQLVALLSRRYGWGLKEVEAKGLGLAGARSAGLFGLGLFGFPNSITTGPAVTSESAPAALRDWFGDAGILICRPAAGSGQALGAALKGGHNDEHHNHNDVGSYVVALGRSTPLLDPGAEVYTARTFSKKRYDSNVLNSFGHSVPRVAGQLQETGRQAAAKILKTDFTDQADTLAMDISSAYKVKELKKLERTFVFSRAGSGKLTVTDAVEFDGPQTFGTAMITFDKWQQLGPNRLQVGDGPDRVIVEIAAQGNEFKIVPEEIHEDLHSKRFPTRLGIELVNPVSRATVTVTIAPGE
jgi:hypothetical protein